MHVLKQNGRVSFKRLKRRIRSFRISIVVRRRNLNFYLSPTVHVHVLFISLLCVIVISWYKCYIGYSCTCVCIEPKSECTSIHDILYMHEATLNNELFPYLEVLNKRCIFEEWLHHAYFSVVPGLQEPMKTLGRSVKLPCIKWKSVFVIILQAVTILITREPHPPDMLAALTTTCTCYVQSWLRKRSWISL